MKTKLRRLEEENNRKDKQIEQLLDPSRVTICWGGIKVGQKTAKQRWPSSPRFSRVQESVVCWLLGMLSLNTGGGWLVWRDFCFVCLSLPVQLSSKKIMPCCAVKFV